MIKIISYTLFFLSSIFIISCNSVSSNEKKIVNNTEVKNSLFMNFIELRKEKVENYEYLTAEYTFYTCDTNYQLPFVDLDSLQINGFKAIIFDDIITIHNKNQIKEIGCNRIKMFHAYTMLGDTDQDQFIKMNNYQIDIDSLFLVDKNSKLKISCARKPGIGYLPPLQ